MCCNCSRFTECALRVAPPVINGDSADGVLEADYLNPDNGRLPVRKLPGCEFPLGPASNCRRVATVAPPITWCGIRRWLPLTAH